MQCAFCLIALAQFPAPTYIGSMTKFPTLFISHGSPNMILHASPARDFLSGLGKTLPRPDAILVMSAHFETDQPVVVADEQSKMIYDFGGFEPEMYTMQYPAPGALGLAVEAAQLVENAGFKAVAASGRGYDHGTWVPLKLIYPDADIPVAQISVQPHRGGAHHAAVGRALSALREKGVLVIGSGGATHNLRALYMGGYTDEDPAPAWVADFDEWVRDKAEGGDLDALADFERSAPFARENHPSPEHFLPMPFAFGAAGEGAKGERIHASVQRGVLMLDAYRFN